MEWFEEIVALCDDDMLGWLLYFAERPHKAGIGKTTDYHTQIGPASAWAKRQGLKVDFKRGYDRLIRVEFPSPRGKNKLFLADKPELIRFTTVAIGVLQHLATRQKWREDLLIRLGAKIEREEKWFPVPVEPKTPIQMVTTSPRASAEPFDITVTASFNCPRCTALVEHSYPLRWRDEEWYATRVICKCGSIWTHPKGFPYAKPTPENG